GIGEHPGVSLGHSSHLHQDLSECAGIGRGIEKSIPSVASVTGSDGQGEAPHRGFPGRVFRGRGIGRPGQSEGDGADKGDGGQWKFHVPGSLMRARENWKKRSGKSNRSGPAAPAVSLPASQPATAESMGKGRSEATKKKRSNPGVVSNSKANSRGTLRPVARGAAMFPPSGRCQVTLPSRSREKMAPYSRPAAS